MPGEKCQTCGGDLDQGCCETPTRAYKLKRRDDMPCAEVCRPVEKLRAELAEAHKEIERLKKELSIHISMFDESRMKLDALQARIDGAVKGWAEFDTGNFLIGITTDDSPAPLNPGGRPGAEPVRIMRESEGEL